MIKGLLSIGDGFFEYNNNIVYLDHNFKDINRLEFVRMRGGYIIIRLIGSSADDGSNISLNKSFRYNSQTGEFDSETIEYLILDHCSNLPEDQITAVKMKVIQSLV
jgi:hypothetical protein